MSEQEKLEMEALDEIAGGKGMGQALKARYKRMSGAQKTALWSALGVIGTGATAAAVDQLAYKGAGRKWVGSKIKQGASTVANAVKSWRLNTDTKEEEEVEKTPVTPKQEDGTIRKAFVTDDDEGWTSDTD